MFIFFFTLLDFNLELNLETFFSISTSCSNSYGLLVAADPHFEGTFVLLLRNPF